MRIYQDQEYCKDTGRKVKVYCLGSVAEETDYKPCNEEENSLMEVVQFQVIVAAIGSLTFWAAQQRKKKNSNNAFREQKISSLTSQGY